MTAPDAAREKNLLAAFVSLTDTLVNGFDVVDMLGELTATCVRLLDVTAAGIMLSDQRGLLRVLASSTETTRLLELLQLQNDAGPCLECYRTSRIVEVADLTLPDSRWPTFAAAAQEAGFASICAIPLRLRQQTIGAMNLLRREPGTMPHADRQLAQALADVATIGVLQHRAVMRSEEVTMQLQGALNSRLVVEQAKGLLSERASISLETAFDLLRSYSRPRGERLSEVARRFVDGSLSVDDLRSIRPPARTPSRTADSRRPTPGC
jgi:transcriptional regulator with GAF, ATPase, and Fis domain